MSLKAVALFKFFLDIICNVFTKKQLVLISEGFDWVIHEECLVIKKYMESHGLVSVRIATTPIGLRNKIIHFMSENTLIGRHGLRYKKGSNRFILSWFHISDADKYRTKYIPLLNKEIDFLHTSAEITATKIIHYGLNPDKIIKVGLDVNLDVFHPVSIEEKIALRKRLGLPTNKILIGSFQKDGNGWGEGSEPKLIKGPDIFCKVVENLAKDYPIHVVLTGPARGYVKNRLNKANVPYTHTYLKHYEQVAMYFQAIDLYLITSREEGGPKALLESMATGTPFVSTRVGMVPDVIEDGVDGFMVEIDNIMLLEKRSRQLLKNETLRKSLVEKALTKVSNYSSNRMVEKLFDKIYRPLIS